MSSEQLLKNLENLDKQLLAKIKEILGSDATKDDIISFVQSPEFDALLKEKGVGKWVSEYVSGLDNVIITTDKKPPGTMLAATKQIINTITEMVINTKGRKLLGHFQDKIEVVKSKDGHPRIKFDWVFINDFCRGAR